MMAVRIQQRLEQTEHFARVKKSDILWTWASGGSRWLCTWIWLWEGNLPYV